MKNNEEENLQTFVENPKQVGRKVRTDRRVYLVWFEHSLLGVGARGPSRGGLECEAGSAASAVLESVGLAAEGAGPGCLQGSAPPPHRPAHKRWAQMNED